MAARPTVLIDSRFPPEQQAWLEAHASVVLLGDVEAGTVDPACVEAIIWYGHGPVTGDLLDRFANLKVVSNFGTGYEFIDANAAAERGIPVGHTPGCLADAVADFTMALLLAAARDVVGGANDCAAPSFTAIDSGRLGKQVSGATMGIVGMGSIGAEVARRAAGFKMRLLYHNRSRRSPEEEAELGGAVYMPSLMHMLPQCDYVVLVVPATPSTTKLMGAAQFAAMKSDALLVNIARGVVVDQDALVDALMHGQIGAAALDVTDPEPLPRDHPLVATAGTPLAGRVLITPHQGSATAETRLMMMKMAFDNAIAGMNPLRPRLPWTVPECERLFEAGCAVGSNAHSGRSPKP
eukprot:m.213944 g.213944  ORF g.213944 m.213944 type:complete len:351 (-) comp26926_c0_seq1:168-1220(-)